MVANRMDICMNKGKNIGMDRGIVDGWIDVINIEEIKMSPSVMVCYKVSIKRWIEAWTEGWIEGRMEA